MRRKRRRDDDQYDAHMDEPGGRRDDWDERRAGDFPPDDWGGRNWDRAGRGDWDGGEDWGRANGGRPDGGRGGYPGSRHPEQGSGESGWGHLRQGRGDYPDAGYGGRGNGPSSDRPIFTPTGNADGGYDGYDGAGHEGASRDGMGRDGMGRAGSRAAGQFGRPRPADPEPGVPQFTPAPFPPPSGAAGGNSRPYGRLSIFTLDEEGAAEFDRLAERAAEGVRASEPDTLVYVIHLVPKAPLQRIIYEIYRDTAAFENHERQPYIQQFAADRKSCVVATNSIDLRLKYAFVSPLQETSPAGREVESRSPRAVESGTRATGNGRHPDRGNGGYGDPDAGHDWFGGHGGDHRGADPGNGRYPDWEQPQYPGQRYGGS